MENEKMQGRNQSRRARRRMKRLRLAVVWTMIQLAIAAVLLAKLLQYAPLKAERLATGGQIRPSAQPAQIAPPSSPLAPGLEGQESQSADEAGPWQLTLVNKQNPIPENYQIDLVELDGGEQVDRRIYQPLAEMLEAAKEGNWGKLPRVVSGYRTREKQQSLYDNKIAEYCKQGYSESQAEEMAGQWVAKPGHSEHQLGFAVDINGETYDAYLWLQANSYKYGFIFRYPGNKTEITGTAEEVWHYRYVGIEAATEIYNKGICLEEYLEQNSLLPES